MKDRIIIPKLLVYIDKISSYTSEMDIKDLPRNTMALEACVFCLSQMGELTKTLSDDFKASHPEVPWASMAGLRNRIVHDYEGVNVDLICDIIGNDLAGLKIKLHKISSSWEKLDDDAVGET
ncbi:MAG: DUF86 domain-containing protein [Coriobacteriia bacterium]|nr:DUF86 domain-containing protein [Coriobacteriia bacterium]